MTRKQALEYVKNTNGGATVEIFIEDWEPTGQLEWHLLTEARLVRVDEDGRIWLTPLGERKLAELST